MLTRTIESHQLEANRLIREAKGNLEG
jgi:hypothetical protein